MKTLFRERFVNMISKIFIIKPQSIAICNAKSVMYCLRSQITSHFDMRYRGNRSLLFKVILPCLYHMKFIVTSNCNDYQCSYSFSCFE